MKVLAIDTSSAICSVAVIDGVAQLMTLNSAKDKIVKIFFIVCSF